MKFFVLPSLHSKEGPHLKRRSQAENPSAQSDLALEIRYNVRTAWESLCLLYLSLHFPYWETETIVRAISRRAYQFSYEGEWLTVQRFLEEQIDNPQQFEDRWEEISLRPKHEFYGNLLPLSAKMERRLDYRDNSKSYSHKVRYPQRKRGYADKGSSRLPHEKHGDPPMKKEKIDRRNNIKFHPLLLLDSTSEGSVATAHISQERRLLHDHHRDFNNPNGYPTPEEQTY